MTAVPSREPQMPTPVRLAGIDAEVRARTAEAVLEATGTAAILLDRSAGVLTMNRPAEAMAGSADGFRVICGRMSPSAASQCLPFRRLVMDAAAMPGREHAIALERVSGRRPLLLLVSPFGAGRALVRATDPEEAMPCSATILRALYGLTSAEVEVANGLVRGATIEEIADARGTSVATARTQLKMLLAKTDTRRQAELVRLLLRLPRSSAS